MPERETSYDDDLKWFPQVQIKFGKHTVLVLIFSSVTIPVKGLTAIILDDFFPPKGEYAFTFF